MMPTLGRHSEQIWLPSIGHCHERLLSVGERPDTDSWLYGRNADWKASHKADGLSLDSQSARLLHSVSCRPASADFSTTRP